MGKNNEKKKLQLKKDTLKDLTDKQMTEVLGGAGRPSGYCRCSGD